MLLPFDYWVLHTRALRQDTSLLSRNLAGRITFHSEKVHLYQDNEIPLKEGREGGEGGREEGRK